MGMTILGRRAIGQCILSSITASTGIPAALLRRKRLTGKASAGGASTITLAANAALGTALEGFFDGCKVEILAGAGAGQVRKIASYVGSTRVATTSVAWVTNPDNTSVYQVIHDLENVPAQTALIKVETATVNICIDGSTPTVAAGTNVGMQLASGQSWLLDDSNNVENFRVINTADASGSVVKVIVFA